MHAWFMVTRDNHFLSLPSPSSGIICPTQPEMLKEINQQMRDSVEKKAPYIQDKKVGSENIMGKGGV